MKAYTISIKTKKGTSYIKGGDTTTDLNKAQTIGKLETAEMVYNRNVKKMKSSKDIIEVALIEVEK